MQAAKCQWSQVRPVPCGKGHRHLENSKPSPMSRSATSGMLRCTTCRRVGTSVAAVRTMGTGGCHMGTGGIRWVPVRVWPDGSRLARPCPSPGLVLALALSWLCPGSVLALVLVWLVGHAGLAGRSCRSCRLSFSYGKFQNCQISALRNTPVSELGTGSQPGKSTALIMSLMLSRQSGQKTSFSLSPFD